MRCGGCGWKNWKRLVRERFEMLDDRERTARSAVAKLESDFVRRFLLLEERHA